MSNYNQDIQKLYLEMFLADAETFVRCQNIFDPQNFDRKFQESAKFITEYVDKYKVMPELDIVNSSCQTEFKSAVDVPKENYEWLMNEFENFSRHKGLERAILQSADMLEKGEYGPVENLIKQAVQISLNKDMGTDYFDDPRARLMKLKDNNGQISTGYPSIDKKLYGGFKRGELNIWCAGSGGGKSLFLANLGVNFALAGLNVIYFTFELSEELVGMRVDSMLTGIASKDIFKNLDDVEMKVKLTGKKAGGMQIKYLPSGKNCNDLRSYLKEYQVKTGKKPDIILVDYLDLMMPLSVKVSPSDLFVKDKYVSEELRNFAMETQCVVVTAAQLNRSAVEEIEFDHSHISGGLSKIQTADNVIGIFTSRAMRERGRYQIQFMKTRSSSGVGQKVDLEFDVDSLRIKDIEEEESNGYSQSNKPSASILDGIKKQSTVSEFQRAQPREGFDPLNPAHNAGRDDPTQGISIGKVRGTAESAKIRDLIKNLNTEKD
jgi:archaellum biogenesis ATPase FlaH